MNLLTILQAMCSKENGIGCRVRAIQRKMLVLAFILAVKKKLTQFMSETQTTITSQQKSLRFLHPTQAQEARVPIKLFLVKSTLRTPEVKT